MRAFTVEQRGFLEAMNKLYGKWFHRKCPPYAPAYHSAHAVAGSISRRTIALDSFAWKLAREMTALRTLWLKTISMKERWPRTVQSRPSSNVVTWETTSWCWSLGRNRHQP